jgi:D-serine deaminase-like pyridoxal phosphate-dependent protein
VSDITQLETPALLLDARTLDRNLARMQTHLRALGVELRPHVKTAKSIEVVSRALAGQRSHITVSTLKEAEYFLGHGINDILYAVTIAPGKLAHVMSLYRRGARIAVVVDNVVTVQAAGAAAAAADIVLPVFIELDVDGHRSGVAPRSALLIDVARAVSASTHLRLRGVMTHAGGSYNCTSTQAIADMAEQERSGATLAAQRLRDNDMPVSVVSVGSTPTATFARNLEGVNEVRVGVYMFQDLVMAGLDVCEVADIALSVLVAVIGHQPEKGWIITDGGWMAMSRDRGTANQRIDQGYGIVCDVHGRPLPEDLIVVSVNQEHGIVAKREGSPINTEHYPIGTLLRILPNHACATAAQHDRYHVVAAQETEVLGIWSRFSGW